MTAGNPFPIPVWQKGFTLLEVMVSIMVLAVVLVTLFRLHAGTINLASAGKIKAMMPHLAQYQLSLLETENNAQPGGLSGTFADAYAAFEWSCTIDTADFQDPVELSDDQSDRLKKIDLTIIGPGGGSSFTITTWRYLVEDENE